MLLTGRGVQEDVLILPRRLRRLGATVAKQRPRECLLQTRAQIRRSMGSLTDNTFKFASRVFVAGSSGSMRPGALLFR